MNGSKTPAVRIDAQAKINVALRILGRDQSGYHPLETVFLRLDLADQLTIRTDAKDKSVASDVDIGPPEQNLAYKAALAFSDAAAWPDNWRIDIRKRIPMGAGLGGGSADAGAVLRALNFIAPAPLSSADIHAIAARLGADVPFMAGESVMAFAKGYGEILAELPPPESREVALVIPDFQVGTREAYGWVDCDAAAQSGRTSWNLENPSWSALDSIARNDFEAVVERRHPEVAGIVASLKSSGAKAAFLTGSGSAVVGLFEKGGEMRSISLPAGAKLLRTHTAIRVVQPQLMG